MELKYVIPNITQTFGNLEYTGEGKVEHHRINERGYANKGNHIISEFYALPVPKGHDFLKEVEKEAYKRLSSTAACEAKAAALD